MLFILFLCVFVIFVISILYWKVIHPSKHIYDILRKQGVSGEPFIPLIGQTSELRRYREEGQLLEYHKKMTAKHGLTYLFSFGPYPRLAIQDPEYLSDILGRMQAEHFYKPADFSFRLKPLIGTQNLLVSNGKEHERARKMLNPAFHSDNLQSMLSIMTEHTQKTIDTLLECSSVVDITKYLNKLTLSIIISSALGTDFGNDSNSQDLIARTFTDILKALVYRFARLIVFIPILSQLPFWKKDIIDQGAQELDRFVQKIINDRRQGRSQSQCVNADLLDLLLSAVDNQNQGFTDQEIRDQALTFILAGHETTSNLMAWVMYELMINPTVYRDCQNEVDRILSDGLPLTCAQLNQLPIIEAVLQETLRLHPPAPFFARQCIKEQIIGKTTERPLRIPKGLTILVNTYAIHRRAEYWPQPTVFDYTRWLRDSTTGLKPKLTHPFCYLPFAAGPRNCIGQNFALLEAKVMLAMFVQQCQFELEVGQQVIPEVRITMRPKYGLRMRISQR